MQHSKEVLSDQFAVEWIVLKNLNKWTVQVAGYLHVFDMIITEMLLWFASFKRSSSAVETWLPFWLGKILLTALVQVQSAFSILGRWLVNCKIGTFYSINGLRTIWYVKWTATTSAVKAQGTVCPCRVFGFIYVLQGQWNCRWAPARYDADKNIHSSTEIVQLYMYKNIQTFTTWMKIKRTLTFSLCGQGRRLANWRSWLVFEETPSHRL